MKKILIIVVILAALLLIPPYFIGSKVKSVINEQVEIAKNYPAYEVRISDYQKGWFTSQVKFELSVPLPIDAVAAEKINFEVTQSMQHGPILWQSGGLGFGLMDADINFNLPQTIQSELDKVKQINDDTLSIVSRTSFDLSNNVQFKLNPIVIDDEDMKIDIKAAEGFFSYTMAGHVQGQSEWEGMTMSESNQKMEVAKVTMALDQQLVSGKIFAPDAIYAGDFEIKMASLNVEADEKINLNDVSIFANSDVKQELAQIAVGIKAASIDAIGQNFKNLKYDFKLENMDVKTLQEMNRLMVQSQTADPMAAAAQMQSFLPKLLETGPVLKNNLGVETGEGAINTDVIMTVDNDVYDPDNPMTMMIAINAEANGHGPEAFFATFGLAPTIEQLVQQNMLIRDKSNLKFEFTFKGGQASLNGAPMPMGAF